MLPYQQIRIGDQYRNPFLYPVGNIYTVLEKDNDEKMVKVQAVCSKTYKNIGSPFWVKNTNRVFSESWRVE